MRIGIIDCFSESQLNWVKYDTLPETNSSPMKIPIFHGKYHQNGGFSMAMLEYRGVHNYNLPTETKVPAHFATSLEMFHPPKKCSKTTRRFLVSRIPTFLIHPRELVIVVSGTLPETNSSPLKIGLPKRKVTFQPSIFRCELLVSGRVIHPRLILMFRLTNHDTFKINFSPFPI